MSIASVTTRGYEPGGGTLPLTLTLGYALAGIAPPPPPPVTPPPAARGAPIWWRGRRDEEEEDDGEETDAEIRIVPAEDEPVANEADAIAKAVPLSEYLPPRETNYAAVAEAARAKQAPEFREISAENRIERFLDEQERKRKRRMRQDEDLLLLS